VRALTLIRRREVLTGFILLASLIAGHTLLETARDALFLARIPATRLPWMYLSIAGFTLVTTQVRIPALERFGRRKLLALGLAFGAAVTTVFWFIQSSGTWVLYALYLWPALFSSLVLVTFWLTLDEDFTVTEAKKVYGFIGAGSAIGAAIGAAIARGLVERYAARDLLLVAAAFFLGGAVLIGVLSRGKSSPPVQASEIPSWKSLRQIDAAPYLRRLLAIALLVSISATLADYLFKSWVSRSVPSDRFVSIFASVSLAQSVLGFAVQVVGVSWLLRTAGVTRALLVLPLAFLVGGVGLAAAGGLALAVALKIADGTLRYSVQRTGNELLFLPVDNPIRQRVKPLIDVVGQRLGQSLAAIGVLSLGAATSAPRILAAALAAVAVCWGWLVIGLQSGYVELFRQILRRGRLPVLTEVPHLDLGALETLLKALNSSDDGEVLTALELLVAYRRTHLIPAMILFHPSREIVLRTLEYFAEAERKNDVAILDRLQRHTDPEIRAAALRAKCVRTEEDKDLRGALADESPIVRATALVGLTATGGLKAEETSKQLVDLLAEPGEPKHLAVAAAIRRQPHPQFESLLLTLAKSNSAAVKVEVGHAMRQMPSTSFLPALIEMLSVRAARAAAREALLAIGDPALEYLENAMEDFTVHRSARRAIPGTLAFFPPQAAAAPLLRKLRDAKEGVVRYRILRSLRYLQERHPNILLDREVLKDATRQTMTIAFRNLHWRLTLEKQERTEPSLPGQQLLGALLRDKETLAIDRMFRLFHLLHPREDFDWISRGFRSENAVLRSSAEELLESVLPPSERDAVLALIGNSDSDDRFQAGLRYYAFRPLTLEQLLDELLQASSGTVRCLAAYHAAELGLQQFRPKLEALRATAPCELAEVVDHALLMFSAGSQTKAAYAG
jgi:AAA family ATP:ADP antiporter